ncbi:2-C-methyl-D-erythritol 4-phosphate cytidylyltransferase [Alkalibacter rhizosphaerae]|uniref:2-C-methyl-D-erythritol 4-phosphate cytidylyltransferase n=1 Tax=Alkalibacter rhizosphaerae TaxID=2815577 RepID=A0A974XE33_9FIRM|nr:2-C-methyl-D-erythritol 4-phosphate cytidylyltransferase [Alkalibacter rhizosphaerae]QSX08159.1 2-C-methyl-D-erythritol 4-phosphate cytidylyltransferase [Alkalibacter rhizosphaerae]
MGKPFVSAIIVAAGNGSRMNAGRNKQYLYLNGKPILVHTLKAFEKCGSIDEVILVISAQDAALCREEVLATNGFKKIKALVFGGQTRQESMYNGLREVSKQAEIVVTHDGARPLIHTKTLTQCVEETITHGATIVAVPVKETIKMVGDDLEVIDTPKRSCLWSVQTPQTFRRELLEEAHKSAKEAGFLGTDDAMLVERLGHPVKVVKGHYENIKITTPEDLILAESIFQRLL